MSPMGNEELYIDNGMIMAFDGHNYQKAVSIFRCFLFENAVVGMY
jgi:hypothetical protein